MNTLYHLRISQKLYTTLNKCENCDRSTSIIKQCDYHEFLYQFYWKVYNAHTQTYPNDENRSNQPLH